MNKKKLIKKLALPAGVITIISIIVLLLQIPFYNVKDAQHKEEFKKYISSFMDQNKTYLKSISDKIKALPVNPVIVNELQSEYVLDHQKANVAKKYLWMSGVNGEFVFGVPFDPFDKMNEIYEKNAEIIKADNFFRSRNDFLKKLIDKYNKVDFSKHDRRDYSERDYSESEWRFYNEQREWIFIQPTSTFYSTPVYDNTGKIIGDLFMKVDDDAHKESYLKPEHINNNDIFSVLQVIFVTLLSISGAFLWFLLPTWVYIDAQDRDVRNPGIWAFLTLISFFFGLTIYLITRPAETKAYNCPKCDGELNGTRAYCPHCGFDLANTFCRQCQYPIKTEWQFCPNCRTETGRPEAPSTEV